MSPLARRFSLFLLLGLAIGCRGTPDRDATPDVHAREGSELLTCLYLYRGTYGGDATRPTGLLRRADEGWESLTWTSLISSAIDVDPSGRWVWLAAGDGVHVSRDGGRTWWLTGGIDVMEVQDVCIDARDPRRGWAATAYGLFHADDVREDLPWRELDPEARIGFTSAVVQDRSAPDRLWVAGDRGVFLSEDGGETLRRTSADLPIRRITQDWGDDRRVWAASDGGGLLESNDHGRTWRATEAPSLNVYCLEQHPAKANVLFCGDRGHVHRSDDGGRTWHASQGGIDEGVFVFDVAVDPASPERVLSSGTDGIHESLDGGSTWAPFDLQGAMTYDVRFASLADVPRAGPDDRPGRLRLAEPDRVFVEHRPAAVAGFASRRDDMLAAFAALPRPAEDAPLSFFSAWMELLRGHDGPKTWSRLLPHLEEPQNSMFYGIQAIGFFLHHRDRLSPEMAELFCEVLTENPIYRGDTENHWVMHYATMLLAAQTFPETPAAQWYTGRGTQSMYDEARAWIFHWARLATARGQGEFDSPHYVFMYVSSMLLLYDFAEEPAVRQLAGMMLDLILADYFSESLDGAYCGGHSREVHVRQTTDASVVALHDLYAGGIPAVEKPTAWMLLALHSRYVPPPLLATMANERDRAWVQTEVKRVRNVIRFGEELNPPVYEYEYVTPGYIMGSLQGGILQPIQQHTWDVTWRSDEPGATLFTVHPWVSGRELAMFFPEDVHVLVQSVTAQKGVYGSPDKMMSSSPYERVFQHENVLLAVYKVPSEERFPHVDLHVPRFLKRHEVGGWWFGRDGDFHVAWFATEDGEWTELEDHDRFRCSGARAGFVVVTRPVPSEEVTFPVGGERFERFKAEILEAPRPRLRDKGEFLVLEWTLSALDGCYKAWDEGTGTANFGGGRSRRFPVDALYDGPFLQAKVDARVITMQAGGQTRVLDFNDLSIRVEE